MKKNVYLFHLVPKNKLLAFMYLALCLLFVSAADIKAQSDRTVSGTVFDENNSPLPGVNVLVKGTAVGVSSDADGKYSVSIPGNVSNPILVFSYIGYESQEIAANNGSVLNVTLKPDVESLNEVVVVGYGTQKVKDLTGSVGIVKIDDAKKTASYDVARLLQGQVAGVSVHGSGEPGGFVSIKIRGISTFGNNSPLFVIDGVPVDAPFDFSPDDIESVQVLKDASAGAIYGSRAATGVIIITTKKGKAGPLKVDYNGYAGLQNIYRNIPVLDRVGYQKVVTAAELNAGLSIAPANDPTNPAFISKTDTDWQKEGLKTANIQDHNLNFSGGTDNLRGSVSLGYFSQTATVTGPQKYTRFTLNSNISGKKGIFTYGAKVAYTQSEKVNSTNTREHAVFGGAVTSLLAAIPTMPVYDPNRLGGYGGSDNATQRAITLNVVGMNNLLKGSSDRNRLLANVWTELEFVKNLKYRLSVSYDRTDFTDVFFEPKYDLGFYYLTTNAYYSEGRGESHTNLLENTLNYTKTFGKHKIELLGGYTFQKNNGSSSFGSVLGLSEPYILTLSAPIDASGGRNVSGASGTSVLSSYLGRLNYNFADRYLLTFNYRRDGSSRFSPQYRHGDYMSVAAAWNVHNDIQLPEFMTTLKLRGGIGELGNQNIGDYRYDTYINANAGYVFGGVLIPGATRTQVVDPSIKWESKRTSNVAVDMGLLRDKLTLTVEYFNNTAYDILADIPIPPSVGSTNTTITTNAASVRNSGIELTATYRHKEGDLNYEISVNGNTLKNKVLELGGSNNPIYGAASKTEVGQPVGQLYGYQIEGIFQNADEIKNHAEQINAAPGDIKFKDVNKDGKVTALDRVYLGNAIPKVYFGANLAASYKGFDLSFFFQGNAGSKVYNGVYRDLMTLQYGNQHTDALNYWTPTNTGTSVPRPIIGDPNANLRDSDRFVESGTYVRLQNAQFGYRFPQTLLSKLKVISNARVYISGQNLFLITKYRGFDPDFSSDGLFSRGYDYGSYPNPRAVMAGLQIGF